MTPHPLIDAEFLQRFGQEMDANAHKGDWRALVDDEDMNWAWILDELDDHVHKLKQAVRYRDGLSRVQEHAADIAGNAMFAFRFARAAHDRTVAAREEAA